MEHFAEESIVTFDPTHKIVEESKKKIDELIYKNQYKEAFRFFLTTTYKLNGTDLQNFIYYYYIKLNE